MSNSRQVVVVTGAAGALGRAVVEAFDKAGADCVLWDHHKDAGGSGTHMTLVVDLLDAKAVDTAAKQVLAAKRRVDVLCNIAGGFASGLEVHESRALFDRMMDLNVRTMLNTVEALVPSMIAAGGGKIINVGASRASAGSAGNGPYIASKSAVIRLTESMGAELRAKNINVNCVLPSIIDTPANRADMPKADPARWVAPAALADVILFLASPAARAINGASIPVTGLS
ncbi:SDR family NAD(P)-dependent oxidoreductase [Mesorhizobium sp. ANAO-SY3R2]|uniref:SDR family NAD(P)-dependent oxidoreductase n=1 Tax=Mesorhizobium sp. ANAO-SY3R2 TaxID=3166644 RepID=UPI003670E127